jgi:hypothetical protein
MGRITNDLHISGCSPVALLCPVTGITGIEKDIYTKHDNEIQGGKKYEKNSYNQGSS